MHHDMTTVTGARTALRGRLAALAGLAETLPPPVLADQIEDLRRAAVADGLMAADRVARAFTSALAESRCRNSFAHWFAALSDAIGGEAADQDMVADACLAAVMTRLG